MKYEARKQHIKIFHLHGGTTVSGRVAHDNTLRYTSNTVSFTISRCIEQMIGRLLEGR